MQKMIGGEGTSSAAWETLETFARAQVQGFIQQLLEDEVAELLGRAKSERRASIDAPRGSRNGHGKPRYLALMNGTITVQRPRVRDVEARFVSRLLPLFQRRTTEVSALLSELYLHGLALGDFELALRGLLGRRGPAECELPRAPQGNVAGAVRRVARARSLPLPTRVSLG